MKIKSWVAIACGILLLSACASQVKVEQKASFAPKTHPETIFIVPFTTIMVPDTVKDRLFDRFVDQLNAAAQPIELEYIILKQGLETIDPEWLAKRDYVTGDIFAYVEDFGSTTTAIRAKSRIRLYQVGSGEPTLQLDYPVEIFYEKDYMTLAEARHKLAQKISDGMARKLTQSLQGPSPSPLP